MKTIINTQAVYTAGNPKNIPVVFIHGFLFDHTMWKNQVNALSENYYCVSYDIRGFGESYVGDGQYTLEAYASDLFSIITELNLIRPVLCGLSLGGYIALRTLERDQSRFRGAVLCNTKSEADSGKDKLLRYSKIDEINLKGLEKFTGEFIKSCFSEKTLGEKENFVSSLIENGCKNNPRGVKGGLFAILSRTDTTDFLPQIKIPALVIAGEKDKKTPAAEMKKMAEKIPDSKFTIIKNAGHISPLENSEEVNAALIAFLKGIK
ncbi:MAG: alpha/beta hydrolase [Ignavibacteria bacterium]|nr:alpha/beta hydrolase [Ignavibacteria bacterium]